MVGFIKDYRKELESDIWLMPPLYHRTWQYLKYKVNHDEADIPMRDGTKFKIFPGQHLTSIRSIAKEIGWYEGRVWKEPNPKTIKTILDWLEKVRMIEIDTGTGNRQYTLITLINWHSYQSKDDRGNSKVTVGKQSAGINKNDKNDSSKHIVDSDECDETFNQFWNAYPKKNGKAKALTKWRSYFKAGSIKMDVVMDGLENYMKYVEHERTVRKFDRQYLDGLTFVNGERWNDDWTIKQSSSKPRNTTSTLNLLSATKEQEELHAEVIRRQREQNKNAGGTRGTSRDVDSAS